MLETRIKGWTEKLPLHVAMSCCFSKKISLRERMRVTGPLQRVIIKVSRWTKELDFVEMHTLNGPNN